MGTLEIAFRCTDPFNVKGGCEFHANGMGMPHGDKRLRFCKHADFDPALCSHVQARQAALRATVREALGAQPGEWGVVREEVRADGSVAERWMIKEGA